MVKRHFTADAPDNRGGVCSGFEKGTIEEKSSEHGTNLSWITNKRERPFKTAADRKRQQTRPDGRRAMADFSAVAKNRKQGNTDETRRYKWIRTNTFVNARIRTLPIEIEIEIEGEIEILSLFPYRFSPCCSANRNFLWRIFICCEVFGAF